MRSAPGVQHVAIAIALAAAVLVACGNSNPNIAAARREYLTAIRGQSTPNQLTVEEQIEHIHRAVQLDPANATYWETRGEYLMRSDPERAERDFDQAILLADRPYLRFERGAVRCQQKRYERALADLDLAIAAQPSNTQFYLPRAIARAAVHDVEGAAADAEILIAQTPQRFDGYYARGIVFLARGESGQAIADFSRAIALRPELVYPLRARARAYEMAGERALAQKDRASAEDSSHWGWFPCLEPGF